MPPKPDYLSYDDLRNIADDFLDKHWPDRDIPVDIEHIIDVKIGLDIVPIPDHLDGSSSFDAEGLLSSDRDSIWVDETIYSNYLNRYRFTLAHEISHWILHEDIYQHADFSDINEWRNFIQALSEEDRSWYEWQGYSLGGLLLVQEDPLEREIESCKKKLSDNGFDIDLTVQAGRDHLATIVGSSFDVSADVILRRGDYDDFWNHN